jgi:hypothetical protein
LLVDDADDDDAWQALVDGALGIVPYPMCSDRLGQVVSIARIINGLCEMSVLVTKPAPDATRHPTKRSHTA